MQELEVQGASRTLSGKAEGPVQEIEVGADRVAIRAEKHGDPREALSASVCRPEL
jgi:hypothetical protein